MEELQLKAYGKINLALDVLRKRDDGYHDLAMIMQTVGVHDDILITPNNEKDSIRVKTVKDINPDNRGTQTHKDTNSENEGDQAYKNVIPDNQDNLAYKAAKILFDEFNIDDGIDIHITKRIPIAGGMAGGSADCAMVLKGVNQMFELGLNDRELMERGVKLGADVSYCIMGGTALAEGIGDILTPLPTPPQCFTVLAKPDISVSTAYIYSHIKADTIEKRPDIKGMIKAIEEQNLKELAELLYNVVEEVTVPKHPIIATIKNTMMENGALNAIMSGSGPTVFGLFDDKGKAKAAMKVIEENRMTEQLYLTNFVQ